MLRVSLLGNLGADPEVRFTSKGTQLVMFRVAVNQVRTGTDGERQENTEWFRIRVGNPRFSEYVQRLTKGTRVLVIGRLDIGHFQGKDGEPRVSFDVWAEEVHAMSQRGAPEPAGSSEADDDEHTSEFASAGVSSLSNGAGASSSGSGSGSGQSGAGRTARAQPSHRDRTLDSSAPEELEELPF